MKAELACHARPGYAGAEAPRGPAVRRCLPKVVVVPPSGENLACRHLGVDQHCLCRLVELRAGGEEMKAARLKELEEMAAKLLETARKLRSARLPQRAS